MSSIFEETSAADVNRAPGGGAVELLNLPREELEADLKASLGLEPYRAKQLIQWVYRERLTTFDAMTNISKAARELLRGRYTIFRPRIETVQLSSDGTRKFLFELSDGEKIESVLIRQPARYTLCVSSQVGCAVGCRFCRTAQMGLKRNLQASEIVAQVLAVKDVIAELRSRGEIEETESGEDFYNIVFMGMGEPLHNYENVVRSVKLLNDELGLNFSARKITVSTSGLVPAITKFGNSGAEANLAVSLNATTDQVRTKLMPINKRYPLDALLGALREYPLKRRKRITFEYVMLHGINDTEADIERLPRILHGIPTKINLIPYNENAGLGFKSPPTEVVHRWQDQLLQRGLNATIRWSKGIDIDAACGQLASKKGGTQ